MSAPCPVCSAPAVGGYCSTAGCVNKLGPARVPCCWCDAPATERLDQYYEVACAEHARRWPVVAPLKVEGRVGYAFADRLGYGFCADCRPTDRGELDEYTPEQGERCDRCRRVMVPFVECSLHRDCFREAGHRGVCERSDGLALGSGAVLMRDGSGWIDANGYEHSA